MFKFFILFFGLILNKNINLNYVEVVKVAEDKVLDERGGYVLFQNEGFFLRHKASSWLVEIPKAEKYFIAMKDGNFLYLYYTSEGLEAKEYNSLGKLVMSKVILKNPLSLHEIIYNKGLYLFGNISIYQEEFFKAERGDREGEDAIVLHFNENYELIDFKIFGGKFDESFIKALPNDEGFFVAGRKDPEGGGDFGNGGRFKNSLILAKLDQDLSLSSQIILASNSKILDFSFYKDFLYLANENSLYKLTQDLKIIQKKKFSEDFIAATGTFYNKYLFFGCEKIEIIDIIDFQTESINSSYLNPDTKMKILPESIYLTTKDELLKYDLACLENFITLDNYYPELKVPKKVNTIFGEAELIEEEYLQVFDPLICGNYIKEFRFRTLHGLNFALRRTEKIEMRANVSNNNIYPFGYRLQFTGKAKLDGVYILNNHILSEEGAHSLILSDYEGEATEINFFVSKKQISFLENQEFNWDLEVGIGEDFFLELAIKGIDGKEIKAVIFDGEEKRNLIYNPSKNQLSIPLKAPDSSCIREYFLEKLIYSDNGTILSLPLYRVFRVNVLGEIPEVSLNQLSSLEYEIDLDDKDQTLRYLEVILTTEKKEYREIFSLGTQNLIIPNLNSEAYQVKINLVYDPGNRQGEEIMIFYGKFQGDEEGKIGELDILKNGKSLERFKLTFDKSFTELKSQEKVLYKSKNHQFFRNLAGVVLGGGLGFFGFEFFQKLKKKKKRL